MTLIQIFLLGAFAGVTVGAPFGPSGTYCLYKSVQSGWKMGLLAALGSVLTIFLFSFLAALFIDLVAPLIQDQQTIQIIQLIIGLILLLIGVLFIYANLRSKSKKKNKEKENKDASKSFLTAIGLGIISGKNLIGFPTFLLATQYISDTSNPALLAALIFGLGSLIASSFLYFLLVIISVQWGTIVFASILPLLKYIVALIFIGAGLYLITQFFI